MGEVSVSGLKFFAFHGCHPGEQLTGGYFLVDISVEKDMAAEVSTDRIADALDYVALMQVAERQMNVRCNLIETVAHNIASEIKASFQGVGRTKVCVKKLQAPVSFEQDYVSATIVLD